MIYFVNNARCETYLIAVGRIAVCSGGHYLALRQLARQRLGDLFERVRCACDTHCAVDIRAPREGVADSAADAGGRAAEGLDLGRVVVGFVLKEQQPILVTAVNIDLYLNSAGVYFLGFVELVELAVSLEIFHRHGGDIHKAYGLCAPELTPDCHVFVIGALEQLILEYRAVDMGEERGVAAVIRPIGVYHPDFGHSRVTALRFEIILTEFDIVRIHGEAVAAHKIREAVDVKRGEAVKGRNAGGDIILYLQCIGLLEACFTGFNGVDDIFLYRLKLGGGNAAVEHIDLCRAYERAVAPRDELDALRRGIRTLVKLTGQVFDGEAGCGVVLKLGICDIKLRLGEDRADRVIKQLLGDILSVVAVDNAHVGHALYLQKRVDIREQRSCLGGKLFFLLGEYTIDHVICPPLL